MKNFNQKIFLSFESKALNASESNTVTGGSLFSIAKLAIKRAIQLGTAAIAANGAWDIAGDRLCTDEDDCN